MRLAKFTVAFILIMAIIGGSAAMAGYKYGGAHKKGMDKTMQVTDRDEGKYAGKLKKAADGWRKELGDNAFQVDRYAFVVNDMEKMLGIVPGVRLDAGNLEDFQAKASEAPQIVGMLLSDLSILMDPKLDKNTQEPNAAERKFLVYFKEGKCHFGDIAGNMYADSPAEITEVAIAGAGHFFNPNNSSIIVVDGKIHLTYEVRLGTNNSPRYVVVKTVVPDGVWVGE